MLDGGFLKCPLPVARCELRVDIAMPVDDIKTPVDDQNTPVDIKMPVASKKVNMISPVVDKKAPVEMSIKSPVEIITMAVVGEFRVKISENVWKTL